jgi:DNA polymerase-4
MDSFYASVELKDRPELKGKPIAVGGPPDRRGVVATANYEARDFGVRSAMATSTAIRLCPELVVIYPDFSKYKKESRKVRDILSRYATKIEPLSLDEAYLDVTEESVRFGSATKIAEHIRQDIFSELALTASAGVAPNKFLAKIAGEINKPNGLKVIRPEEIESFMKTLPVAKIWGVGKVTSAKMKGQGILTCGDLQKYSIAELTARFGHWGAQLYDYARGIDDREVLEDRERQTLSVEETYSQDLHSEDDCLAKFPEIFEYWNERMMRSGLSERIRGINIKIKYADFTGTTHDRVFHGYPSLSDFTSLFHEAYFKRPDAIRLLGIGVRLEVTKKQPREVAQLKLF